MFNVNIIQKVEIDVIDEAAIAAMITKAITDKHPQVIVNNVTFERKLSPTRIEAVVDASIASAGNLGANALSSAATQTATAVANVPAKAEPQMELNFDTPEEDVTSSSATENKSLDLIDEVLAETAEPKKEEVLTPVADMFKV